MAKLCLPKNLSGMTRAWPYGNGSGAMVALLIQLLLAIRSRLTRPAA
jgi:hypothetical protein